MSYGTLNSIFLIILLATMAGLPVCLAFLWPARVHSLPLWLVLLLAVLCTEAAIYGIFYGIIDPVTQSYRDRHGRHLILDYFVCFLEPWHFWFPIIFLTPIIFLARVSYVQNRERNRNLIP